MAKQTLQQAQVGLMVYGLNLIQMDVRNILKNIHIVKLKKVTG